MATKLQTLIADLTTDLTRQLVVVPWDRVYEVLKLQVVAGSTGGTVTLLLNIKDAEGVIVQTAEILNAAPIQANRDIEKFIYYLRPGQIITGGVSGVTEGQLILSVRETEVPSEDPAL